MAEKKILKEIPTLGTLKKIEIEVEIGNLKCTSKTVRAVTQIVESEWQGKKYLWPNGNCYCNAKLDIRGQGRYARREGAIVVETDARYLLVDYDTGSWRNTYQSFIGLYDVSKDGWIFLLGRVDAEDVNRELYEDAKRRMVEAGYALSRSRPVTNTAAFLLLEIAPSAAQVPPLADLEERIRALERRREELKKELRAVEEELRNLRAKLKLEKMKEAVVDE